MTIYVAEFHDQLSQKLFRIKVEVEVTPYLLTHYPTIKGAYIDMTYSRSQYCRLKSSICLAFM